MTTEKKQSNKKGLLARAAERQWPTRSRFTLSKVSESYDMSERHWLQTMIDEQVAEQPDKLPNDSIDAGLDEEIFGADKIAKEAPVQGQRNESKLSLKALLFEAKDDEPDPTASAAPPDQSLQKPVLNVPVFTREAARIVNNISGLIDLEGTTLRRLLNYVSQTYGNDAAEQVKARLEQDYHVSLEREETETGNSPEINAKGAGPEVGG